MEKEKEINELKEKEIFLNKKIMKFEKGKISNQYNSVENKSNTMSFYNIINKEISGFTKDNLKKFPIKIIKRKNNSISQSTLNNSQTLKKKYNPGTSELSTINFNNNECNTHLYKKNHKFNYNKNTIIDGNFSTYRNKNKERSVNNISRNNFRKNKFIRTSKIPTNITNNHYNVQNNNLLISLNNMNQEKIKIQEKLETYLKLIDTKINNLKNKKDKMITIYKQSKSFLKRNNSSLEKSNSIKNNSRKKKLDKSTILNSKNFDKMNFTYRNYNKISIINLKKRKKK